MPYGLLADLLVLCHAAFILFAIAGGLLCLRWPRAACIHVPAVIWSAIVELAGWICPLTPWENEWRWRAGEAGYGGDFIGHYLLPLIYPTGLTRTVQIAMGLGVLAFKPVGLRLYLEKATKRVIRCCLFCLFALTGCGEDEAEDLLSDYLTRVNNATGTPVVEPGPFTTALQSYPRHRDLLLTQEDLRIGLLDLVALEDCGLAELVAARNSGLGKVLAPSQRLLYEHRFLGLARTCVDTLAQDPDADTELADLLAEVIQAKERDIARAFWNATFAGPEFAGLFSLASKPLPVLGGDGTAIEEALSYLIALQPRLGDTALVIDSKILEGHYATLQQRRYGGQLFHSLETLSHYLDGASAAIEKRLAQKAVCFNGRPTPDARTLHTVFGKFYAGRIQPYLTRVHRQSRTYFMLVDRLAKQSESPDAFRTYRETQLRLDHPAGPWLRFENSIQRHAQTWQRLFDQCGLSVAGSSSAR